MTDLEAANAIAVRIWFRWRHLDLDDLKAQAALLAIQGKAGRELWCDLFDYAEYEHRRRPLDNHEEPAYRWRPACCFVRRAVERLPQRQSMVVRLVYFEDYLRVEAAREMGISKCGVTRLMHSAMTNLRNHFGVAQ